MHKLSKRMARVLGLERDPIVGNIAAHAANVADNGAPFEPSNLNGINVGWADMVDSTEFLVGIVSDVDDHLRNGQAIDLHYVADSAVPIYTRERLNVVMDLQLTGETSEMGGETVVDIAASVLYEYAYSLASILANALEIEIA